MATWMGKDVLLECVASGLALIARVMPEDAPRTEDQHRLVELRGFLYDTSPEDINYQAVLDECKAIRKKYKMLEE